MKKINIFLTLLLCVMMMSCVKMSLPAAFNYEVDVNVSNNDVIITGNYVGATIDKIIVIYSDDKDMVEAYAEEAVIEGNNFSLTLTDLEYAKEYYYCIEFCNELLQNVRSDEVYSFTTMEKIVSQTISVNGVSFTMIAVEGGTFLMGAQNTNPDGANYDSEAFSGESPVHSVTLSDYYIGETEVTQELWEAVMSSIPSSYTDDQKPVGYVSWDDCKEFIEKLNNLTGKNFRLPTEAEWEYAARGGNKSQGYKYSGSYNIEDVAWYIDNSGFTSHNVKIKSPNELGIYDMTGNVWEWCEDWSGNYSSVSQTNPAGPSSGSLRVFRGGSWRSDAGYCRVSIRNYGNPGNRDSYLGLRLALSLSF